MPFNNDVAAPVGNPQEARALPGARPRSPRLARWLSTVAGERGRLRWLGSVLVVYLLLQTGFLALTLAAGAVPNGRVIEALNEGAQQGLWTASDFPSDGVGHVTESNPFAGVSDSYTQCIALTLGVSAAEDRGAVYRALAWPHLGTCSVAIPSLQAVAAGVVADHGYTYNRYWNGSAVLTRPALVIAGVGAVKLIAAALFLVGMSTLLVTAWRRLSPWLAVTLVAPLLLSTNLLTQALDSYPHVLAFAVIAFGAAAGIRFGGHAGPVVFVVGAVAGGVFNFVDFLLNPPVAWAFFVFGAVAGRWAATRGGPRPLLGAGAWAAGGWIGGYAATWITKWIIAVVAFGRPAFDEILGTVGTRLGGQNEGLVLPGFGTATRRNFFFWWDTIPTAKLVALLCFLVFLAVLVLVVKRYGWRGMVVVIAADLPLLIVPLWYEALNNHSQIHLWFTYRAVPTALGIAVSAALLPLVIKPVRRADPVAPSETAR